MTSPGTSPGAGGIGRRQKRMGPAPFASFEDLSDELESPEDKNVAGSVVRLPGIREDITPTTPAIVERSPSPAFAYSGISLVGAINTYPSPTNPVMSSLSLQIKPNIKPTCTPRIDISRASSSSHHDSRDSSPEREIFDSRDPNSAKLGLGFKEDGALDLRSSTEELDFQDVQERKKCKTRPQSPAAQEDSSHIRKDSQCSDIILLSISGRTSRLSSIGSQGSGQSRLSNASHLSVMSGQSALSRSSSPHKMVLETSFCGTKPPKTAKTDVEQAGTKVESEVMERVLLSRKHDPTEAILAEGITVDTSEQKLSKNTSGEAYKPVRPLPVDTATPTSAKQKLREVKSANFQSRTPVNSKPTDTKQKSKSATPSPIIRKKLEEPKYIRIKLKPDTCYDDDDTTIQEIRKPDTLELENIENKNTEQHFEIQNVRSEFSYLPGTEPAKCSSVTPNGSTNLPRDSGIADSNIESITPSPSVSRRSSFASLFKSKEAIISPESPSVPGHKRKNTLTGIIREASDNLRTRSRSRSKSRDGDSHKSSLSTAPSSTESIDSKSKHKSVLSLFKSNKKDKIKSESENSSQETLPSIEGIGKVEFKFNESGVTRINKTHYENPLEAASIRIPLHSPTFYEDRSICQDWKTSSQDSQETVIEAICKNVNVTVEPIPKREEIPTKKNIVNKCTSRQSSTSSENVVFSTKLGNDNEVFTTKLPKQPPKEPEIKSIEINGIDDKIDISKKKIVTSAPSRETEDLKKENSVNKESVQILNKKTLESKSVIGNKEIELKKIENENLKEKRISQISTGALSSVSSIISSNADEDRNSSESERDSEDLPRNKKDRDLKLDLDISEPERKAIVLQQDSFEDELPYIPTTLPLERSAALPIVPIKQRSNFEIKTCPIDRPRSTTPINPSCLEEYCEEVMGSFNIESVTKTIEKLKISLPRNESFDKTNKVKSPRKKESNTNWLEFAEKGISRSTPTQTSDTPPPLPPKGLQKAWINFEDIPEKRKAPKRIQTIPSRSYIEVPESVLQESVVYNYVNPDECKCECHEINAKERERRNKEAHMPVQEDELPLLEDDVPEEEKNGPDCSDRIRLDVAVSDCRSIISDSSVDLSTSIDPHEVSGADASLRTPFTSDLGISSNRSSIVSQDEHQSPGSPNAFPKIS
ncbi:hypothetical protein NQ314_005427 [Rhamnusium bicolor]|uniref:Uncharacterized protein n=1 Tax=Rhamnusium bicolor TaxID=1586634 RepID=A0AAV8ZIU5_9CUCU|nr:hypothetical protein NQ314_005427 [Rhamnusium bicolor]